MKIIYKKGIGREKENKVIYNLIPKKQEPC